ncbi:MAG: bifunctional phosphoglucose/phosphomannose isomerase, partial [Candidatus Omnitrophota bacterium]
SSYSGNTEETLSAYKDASARSAKIIVITSGGKLRKAANSDGVPVVHIPGGLPPRCAFMFSFFPILITLSKLGMVKDERRDISRLISFLKGIRRTHLGRDIGIRKNTAKAIASVLYGKFPVLYGGQDHMDSAATRWRGQFAENAKTLASTHLFPEMDHNEIMGWEHPKRLLKDFVAVILRDKSDHPRVSKRMDVTKKIIEKQGVEVIEVYSMGKDLLSRIFSLIFIGDLVSYYLAMMNKVDPTPVEKIEYLKKELAKS